jgi:hypothetical protein
MRVTETAAKKAATTKRRSTRCDSAWPQSPSGVVIIGDGEKDETPGAA